MLQYKHNKTLSLFFGKFGNKDFTFSFWSVLSQKELSRNSGDTQLKRRERSRKNTLYTGGATLAAQRGSPARIYSGTAVGRTHNRYKHISTPPLNKNMLSQGSCLGRRVRKATVNQTKNNIFTTKRIGRNQDLTKETSKYRRSTKIFNYLNLYA